MKQTQNSGNFACKISTCPGFARLKNLISTKRARTITTVFAFFASSLSLCFLQNPNFASLLRTPATYLNISTSTPNVDFQFNQSELSSSAFKSASIIVSVQTDNALGATTYISSVDENTSLVHSESSVTSKIDSISSSVLESAFSEKTWGFRLGSLSTTVFNPIPKSSSPSEILKTTSATPVLNNINIDFGVKSGNDLASGVYSKQIVFTSIINRTPTTATFLDGETFNTKVTAFNSGKNIEYFKHSNTQPANLGDAIIVSTTTSEKPIYLWYDAATKTDFWWTEADVAYASPSMEFMFSQNLGSNRLELVDLRGINTTSVRSTRCMFGCVGGYMFPGGIKMNIGKINFDEFDTSNVLDMSSMFSGFNEMVGITPVPQADLDLTKFNTSKVKTMKDMFYNSGVSTLDLSNFDTSEVTDMSNMFANMYNIEELDVSNFNTTNLQRAVSMFQNNRVKKIDLHGWQNNNLKDINSMFSYSGAKEINLTNFRTPKVEDMGSLFKDAANLERLNLTSFDTSNVTSMGGMFSNAIKLKSLDVSTFNTEKVEYMGYMFSGCIALPDLNISNFDTSRVTDMKYMFSNLSGVSSLDLSSFNTSHVTDMTYMFFGMTKLKNLNVQSFDTSNVTKMDNMFEGAMKEPMDSVLDLSNFNTSRVTSAKQMFFNTNIKTIYASPLFDVSNIVNSIQMFVGSMRIVGGNGTSFSWSNPTDKTYARIDAPGTPGYFTQKP